MLFKFNQLRKYIVHLKPRALGILYKGVSASRALLPGAERGSSVSLVAIASSVKIK